MYPRRTPARLHGLRPDGVRARDRATARLVANPGCYPTASRGVDALGGAGASCRARVSSIEVRRLRGGSAVRTHALRNATQPVGYGVSAPALRESAGSWGNRHVQPHLSARSRHFRDHYVRRAWHHEEALATSTSGPCEPPLVRLVERRCPKSACRAHELLRVGCRVDPSGGDSLLGSGQPVEGCFGQAVQN